METKVTFTGPGPFHLPTAHYASAEGHENNGVTLILESPIRGLGLEAVNVQMTTYQARELAAALLKAVTKSEGPPKILPPGKRGI